MNFSRRARSFLPVAVLGFHFEVGWRASFSETAERMNSLRLASGMRLRSHSGNFTVTACSVLVIPKTYYLSQYSQVCFGPHLDIQRFLTLPPADDSISLSAKSEILQAQFFNPRPSVLYLARSRKKTAVEEFAKVTPAMDMLLVTGVPLVTAIQFGADRLVVACKA
jgi:hypothetical protein